MQWKWQANQDFGINLHKGKKNCYGNVGMETIAFLLHAACNTNDKGIIRACIMGHATRLFPGRSRAAGSPSGKSQVYDRLLSAATPVRDLQKPVSS